MNRILFTIFALLSILAGCAEQPPANASSADEQRARAEQAQGQLSSEVRR